MKEIISKGFILAIFVLPTMAIGQYVDAGIGFGTSWYRGELYHGGDAFFKQMNASAGIFGRYNFNELVAARLSYSYGKLEGDDAFAEDEQNRSRNLSFRSNVHEVSLRAEINVPGFDPYNYRKPISPYIFAGVGMFFYNPETLYQGEWIELQPLGTEGQGISGYEDRESYKTSQISFPVGSWHQVCTN